MLAAWGSTCTLGLELGSREEVWAAWAQRLLGKFLMGGPKSGLEWTPLGQSCGSVCVWGKARGWLDFEKHFGDNYSPALFRKLEISLGVANLSITFSTTKRWRPSRESADNCHPLREGPRPRDGTAKKAWRKTQHMPSTLGWDAREFREGRHVLFLNPLDRALWWVSWIRAHSNTNFKLQGTRAPTLTIYWGFMEFSGISVLGKLLIVNDDRES